MIFPKLFQQALTLVGTLALVAVPVSSSPTPSLMRRADSPAGIVSGLALLKRTCDAITALDNNNPPGSSGYNPSTELNKLSVFATRYKALEQRFPQPPVQPPFSDADDQSIAEAYNACTTSQNIMLARFIEVRPRISPANVPLYGGKFQNLEIFFNYYSNLLIRLSPGLVAPVAASRLLADPALVAVQAVYPPPLPIIHTPLP